MGQDSSSWLVFEFKCLASRTTFIESPLGIIIKRLEMLFQWYASHLMKSQFVLLYYIFQVLLRVCLFYRGSE